MISGYALLSAGVIDKCLKVTRGNGADEPAQELTEEQARADFMTWYVERLCDFVSHSKGEARTVALACDHLHHATEWLAEKGLIPASDRFPAMR